MFGDGPDQVLARTVASGPNAGRWFYLTDVQGSVRDLVNASSQVKAHLDYDGYGVRTTRRPAVSDRYGTPAGNAGRRRPPAQPGAGLPAGRGRWMQEDPLISRRATTT